MYFCDRFEKLVRSLSNYFNWTVVMAQLAEKFIPIPGVCGFNLIIEIFLQKTFTVCYCKNKHKNRLGWVHFKNYNSEL